MVKVGDRVRYLNAVGGGVVVRIAKDIAYVDEDGFETPVLARECVVVEPAEPVKKEHTHSRTDFTRGSRYIQTGKKRNSRRARDAHRIYLGEPQPHR